MKAKERKQVGQIARNFLETHEWELNKKISRDALKAAGLKYNDLEKLEDLADGIYSEDFRKQLYRYSSAHQLKNAKVGTSAYHSATVLMANHAGSDPVVTYAAAQSIQNELGPSGKRAMQHLVGSPYPRLDAISRDYLKRYAERLRTMTASELAALPPYERLLTHHELKTLRKGDQDFIKTVAEQEAAWVKNMPESDIDQLMTFLDEELRNRNLPKDLQLFYAEQFGRLPLSRENRLIKMSTMLQASDPKVIESVLKSASDLDLKELETLSSVWGSLESRLEVLNRIAGHADLLDSDFIKVEGTRGEFSRKFLNLFSENTDKAMDLRIRAAFKKIPASARKQIYLDLKEDLFDFPDQWRRDYNLEQREYRAFLEMFANEPAELADAVLKETKISSKSLEYIKKIKEKQLVRGTRPAGECQVFLDVLRAVGGTSGP